MMMKSYTSNVLALLFIVLVMACGMPQKKDQIESVQFEEIEIDTDYFDQIDAPFEAVGAEDYAVLGKGVTWRTWIKLHKACMKSKWLRNPYYFGVTNTVNLGSIVDGQDLPQRTIDTTVFNENEISRMFNYGEFANCGYKQDVTLALNVFIQSDIDLDKDLDPEIRAELSKAIKSSKNTQVQVAGWRMNNLIEQHLLDVLRDATPEEKGKIRFYQTLRKEGNKILTKVIEIQGFTSEIILERNISAGLEAKLKEGVTASIGNAGLNTKLHFNNKRAITINSDKTFYVFGEFKKTKSGN